MSRLRFLMILALVAVLTVCVPFDPKNTPLMAKGLTTSAALGIIGNSVLTHASKCDQDQRSIPRMLADEIQQPALDLSLPGQSLDESAALAATALRNPKIRTVVFPISLFALQEWDTDPIRLYALSRLIGPYLPMAELAERAASPTRFSGAPLHAEAAFEYDGQRYPVYDVVKTSYFDVEKTQMPCPENDGANSSFIKALYHHSYLEYPVLENNVNLMASLGAEAARREKLLLVVILPIDYELIDRLGVHGGASLRQQAAKLVADLSTRGMHILDLSDGMPNTEFADRWCACGHLLASGRSKVAARIATSLPAAARATPAH